MLFKRSCLRSKENGQKAKIVRSLERMVDSMLKSSWGSPLHLIIITDQESRAQVLQRELV